MLYRASATACLRPWRPQRRWRVTRREPDRAHCREATPHPAVRSKLTVQTRILIRLRGYVVKTPESRRLPAPDLIRMAFFHHAGSDRSPLDAEAGYRATRTPTQALTVGGASSSLAKALCFAISAFDSRAQRIGCAGQIAFAEFADRCVRNRGCQLGRRASESIGAAPWPTGSYGSWIRLIALEPIQAIEHIDRPAPGA